jgi:hypothetical protein
VTLLNKKTLIVEPEKTIEIPPVMHLAFERIIEVKNKDKDNKLIIDTEDDCVGTHSKILLTISLKPK